MDLFEKIGRELRARWAEFNFDEDRFPELAVDALERARPHEHCSQQQLLRWVAQTHVLSRQGEATFGQPPINLYRDDRLQLEALFWVDGTTAIHQHAFSGAFCVLEGSSVHAVHAFEPRERVNDQLLLGELRATDVEILTPGHVRPIVPGNQFIHALFHLERPTLSLVARSHHAPRHAIQYRYHPPGVALDPFFRPESLSRRLAVLDMLLESAHPELRSFAEVFVDGADATALTLALMRINVNSTGFPLVGPLLERARVKHDNLVRILSQVLSRDRASALLTARRRTIKSPTLRLLLGIVLNVSGRERTLRLVQACVPERNAAHTVLEWLKEMHATPAEEGNALGLELDEDSFWVIHQLLEGKTEQQIASEAERAKKRLRAERVAKLCFVLPFNSVLGRLLDNGGKGY